MRTVENLRHAVLPTLVLFSICPSFVHADASRALSGEFEYGEKYTDVYVEPDASSEARDDEEFDRYVYRNSWLQFDQKLQPKMSVSVRAQQLERDYVSRPALDNTTRYAKLRFSLEPRENWAIWPHVSVRRKEYDDETARDREGGSVFASVEKPVTEGLTLRVGARAEQNSFRTQSASRENATKGSASVGFRYEF